MNKALGAGDKETKVGSIVRWTKGPSTPSALTANQPFYGFVAFVKPNVSYRIILLINLLVPRVLIIITWIFSWLLITVSSTTEIGFLSNFSFFSSYTVRNNDNIIIILFIIKIQCLVIETTSSYPKPKRELFILEYLPICIWSLISWSCIPLVILVQVLYLQ